MTHHALRPGGERASLLCGGLCAACILYAGLAQLSLWIVPCAAAILTLASRAAPPARRAGAASAGFGRGLAQEGLAQAALAALLYLLAYGVAAAVAGRAPERGFGLHEGAVLSTMALAMGAAVWLRRRGRDGSLEDEAAILAELEELSAARIVMPARIFSLAHALGRQPLGFSSAVIEQCLANVDNHHLRRVAMTALRNVGLRDHPLLEVRALVEKGLCDPHPWVRHDAVWTCEALGLDDAALRVRLAEMARSAGSWPDEAAVASSDAEAHAALRAARLIARIQAGGRK